METNSLFPLKYHLRKTDELVEIVAWETAEKGARNESDWVSYIDASGVEHIKEHLTLEWDFMLESPFENNIFKKMVEGDLPKYDLWEARRFELVKEFVLRALGTDRVNVDKAVAFADNVIAALRKSPEAIGEE